MIVIRVMDTGRRPVVDASVLMAPATYLGKEIPRKEAYLITRTNQRGCFDAKERDDTMLRIRSVPFLPHEEVMPLLFYDVFHYDVVMRLDEGFREVPEYTSRFPISVSFDRKDCMLDEPAQPPPTMVVPDDGWNVEGL